MPNRRGLGLSESFGNAAASTQFRELTPGAFEHFTLRAYTDGRDGVPFEDFLVNRQLETTDIPTQRELYVFYTQGLRGEEYDGPAPTGFESLLNHEFAGTTGPHPLARVRDYLFGGE